MNIQPIVAREYRGKNHNEAARAFEADAAVMLAAGYELTSQQWVEAGIGQVVSRGWVVSAFAPPMGRISATYRATPAARSLPAQLPDQARQFSRGFVWVAGALVVLIAGLLIFMAVVK